MRAVLALESRFERTPDGRVWGPVWLEPSFWQRYLDVFDRVAVLARLGRVTEPPVGAGGVDDPRVELVPLPYYIGPWQYARRVWQVRRTIGDEITLRDAVILRAPGAISNLVERVIRNTGQPFAVDVIGDPQDVFGRGGVRSLLRPLWRRWFARRLRWQCAHASAATYVTQAYLQRRYPPAPGAFAVACPDKDLPDEAFVAEPRPGACRNPAELLLIGSLAQLYKAPDVLIRAVALCAQRGRVLRLTIVGQGRHRPELERLARSLGLTDRVRFAGSLPPGPAAVRAAIDDADVFVLPSRTEGLPRVLIEALARAAPCIGSAVGGIPELLAPEDLVPPNDVAALAAKIEEFVSQPARLASTSARNLAHAQQFHVTHTRPIRRAFYEAVRDRTAAWQARRR